MIIAIAIEMNVSDHIALKKSYLLYAHLHNLHGHSKGTQFLIFNLKE